MVLYCSILFTGLTISQMSHFSSALHLSDSNSQDTSRIRKRNANSVSLFGNNSISFPTDANNLFRQVSDRSYDDKVNRVLQQYHEEAERMRSQYATLLNGSSDRRLGEDYVHRKQSETKNTQSGIFICIVIVAVMVVIAFTAIVCRIWAIRHCHSAHDGVIRIFNPRVVLGLFEPSASLADGQIYYEVSSALTDNQLDLYHLPPPLADEPPSYAEVTAADRGSCALQAPESSLSSCASHGSSVSVTLDETNPLHMPMQELHGLT